MTRTRTIAALAATALLASTATATAGSLITGKDIRNGSIAERDLNAKVRTKLHNSGKPGPQGNAGERGLTGQTGIQGPQGIPGTAAAKGDPGQDGAQGPQGLKGDKGDPGTPGEDGQNGASGAPGADGQDGVSGMEFESTTNNYDGVTDGQVVEVIAGCDTGKFAVSGGWQQSTVGTFEVLDAYPSAAGYTVRAVLDADADGDAAVTVHATCIIAN